MSKGEKVYNWTVYSGINYWVNLISSVAIADYFTNKNGRKHLQKAIDKTAKAVASTGLLGIEKAHHHSRVSLETLSLLSGGWLLLIPMKIMEDNKRSIVHWLNGHLGISQCGPDGNQLTPDQIHIEHEQPKQTWLNVIQRRILATLAVVGVGSAVDHLAADKAVKWDRMYTIDGKRYIEPTYLHGKERAAQYITKKVNNGLNAITGSNKFGQNSSSWGQRWLKLAALDTVFTKITAVIMYVTNGSKKVDKHEMPEPAITAASLSPTSLATSLVASALEDSPKEKGFTDKVGTKPDALTHAQRVLSEQNGTSLQTGV